MDPLQPAQQKTDFQPEVYYKLRRMCITSLWYLINFKSEICRRCQAGFRETCLSPSAKKLFSRHVQKALESFFAEGICPSELTSTASLPYHFFTMKMSLHKSMGERPRNTKIQIPTKIPLSCLGEDEAASTKSGMYH